VVSIVLAAVVVAVRAVRTGGANGDGDQGASRSTRQPDAAEGSRR
jgi:hypothetical protein